MLGLMLGFPPKQAKENQARGKNPTKILKASPKTKPSLGLGPWERQAPGRERRARFRDLPERGPSATARPPRTS